MKVETLKNTSPVYAWAWVFEGGLCKWAMPSRKQLIAEGKPSPEAKAIRVQIVPQRKPKR